MRLDEAVDLKEVARITSGFVGADLANLVNEAALLAARAGKPTVTMQEFNEGVERVTAGLEKRQRIMHADEKQRVAYHESAHALVAASLPNTDPVHKVSIIPRGLAALGYTMQRPEGDRYLLTQSELESRIQVLLAGTVAEEIDLRRRLHRRPERPGAGHRDRPQHGHGLRHEPAGPGDVSGEPPADVSRRPGGIPGERTHSEQTAREIDEEIRRILAEALGQVRHILETRRPALVAHCRAPDRAGDDRQQRIEAADRGQLAQSDDRARHGRGGSLEAGGRRRFRRARPARKGRGKGQLRGPPTSFHRTGML